MDEYIAFLKEDDDNTRPFRARRLELIVREFGPPRHLLLPGGLMSLHAFEEARHAYVRGMYVATVLLSQTALEHMLGGSLHAAGHNGKWGFRRILEVARVESHISQAEFDLFDRLRRLRNPYVHASLPLDEGTIGHRIVDRANGTDAADLMEEDATLAITSLLQISRRRPFGFSD